MGISDVPIYSNSNVIEIRTNQGGAFSKLLGCIKDKLPDTCLLFDNDGLKILQMDTASTFVVDVKLDGENFEHFYCDTSNNSKKVIDLYFNANHLNSVFKCMNKDDIILIISYEHNSDYINIMFENPKKNEVKGFQVPTQNPENDTPMGQICADIINNCEYRLSMPTSDLSSICRGLKNLDCERVDISHDGETLRFSSGGSVKCEFIRRGGDSEDDLHFTKLPPPDDNEGPYRGTFRFSTLNEFTKSQGTGDGKIVQILLSRDSPLVLHYEIGTLGEMYIAMSAFVNEYYD